MRKSRNKFLWAFAASFCTTIAVAQSQESLNTDRPDQSEGGIYPTQRTISSRKWTCF